MGEVRWKGIVWRGAFGECSVEDLLATLKGFGPLEVLAFEKPGCFRGLLSLAASRHGVRDVTLYRLEVLEPRRQGQGRAVLALLRKTFGGRIFVEDPGGEESAEGIRVSLPFWLRMMHEGLVDSFEGQIESLGEECEGEGGAP